MDWDLLHLFELNDDEATNAAGIRLQKHEYTAVLRMRQTPFKKGGSHHNALRTSAQEMFRVTTPKTNLRPRRVPFR